MHTATFAKGSCHPIIHSAICWTVAEQRLNSRKKMQDTVGINNMKFFCSFSKIYAN